MKSTVARGVEFRERSGLSDSERYPLRSVGRSADDGRVWNWAHNAVLASKTQSRKPRTEKVLRRIVAAHPGRVRVVGSRFSAGPLLRGDETELLIDMTAIAGVLDVTDDTITFAGGTQLSVVFDTLTRMGRMLDCSPGVIATQTIAGAISTGTHGQGMNHASLADVVVAMRLVLADGSVLTVERGDAMFSAVQVALGCLGVITAVTLQTVAIRIFTCYKDAVSADSLESDLLQWSDTFEISKAWWFVDDNVVHVWNAHEALPDHADRYRGTGGQVIEHAVGDSSLNDTIDAVLARMRRDTLIVGDTGEQFRTVTRFRDFTDVTGDINQLFCRGIAVPQINVEIAVPLDRAGAAIRKFRDWYAADRFHLHYPIILRCTCASSAWLSPAYQDSTCFFGFVVYYADDGTLSAEGLDFIEKAERLLAAEGGRPHWGKYFNPDLYRWDQLYPQWSQFCDLRDELDPAGKFSNEHTRRLFGTAL